jgi:hypothetical protein
VTGDRDFRSIGGCHSVLSLPCPAALKPICLGGCLTNPILPELELNEIVARQRLSPAGFAHELKRLC